MQDKIYSLLVKNKTLRLFGMPIAILKIISEYTDYKERKFKNELYEHFLPNNRTYYITKGYFFSDIICTGPKTKYHNYNLRIRKDNQKYGRNRKVYAHHGGMFLELIDGGNENNNQDYYQKWEAGFALMTCNCLTSSESLFCKSTC